MQKHKCKNTNTNTKHKHKYKTQTNKQPEYVKMTTSLPPAHTSQWCGKKYWKNRKTNYGNGQNKQKGLPTLQTALIFDQNMQVFVYL